MNTTTTKQQCKVPMASAAPTEVTKKAAKKKKSTAAGGGKKQQQSKKGGGGCGIKKYSGWGRRQQQYDDSSCLPVFTAASRVSSSSSSSGGYWSRYPQEVVCSASEAVAITSPPECDCWTKFASGSMEWFSPSAFNPNMWTDELRECGMLDNAKVCMCARHLSAVDNTHRKMHISLKNGEFKIDLPVLHSPGIIPGCAAYAQHDYCLTCRRFERKRFFAQKPDTPICWLRCGGGLATAAPVGQQGGDDEAATADDEKLAAIAIDE